MSRLHLRARCFGYRLTLEDHTLTIKLAWYSTKRFKKIGKGKERRPVPTKVTIGAASVVDKSLKLTKGGGGGALKFRAQTRCPWTMTGRYVFRFGPTQRSRFNTIGIVLAAGGRRFSAGGTARRGGRVRQWFRGFGGLGRRTRQASAEYGRPGGVAPSLPKVPRQAPPAPPRYAPLPTRRTTGK